MDRGFDILELVPTDQLLKHEIEAASLVRFMEYDLQSQPRIEWPPALPVVRSCLDQLVRGQALPAGRTTAIGAAIDPAEQLQGKERRDALNQLAKAVGRDVGLVEGPGAREGDDCRHEVAGQGEQPVR